MKVLNLKKIIANLGVLLITLLVLLVVAEICLRVIGFGGSRRSNKGRQVILQPSSNPDIKYELIPGTDVYAWGADIKINADGFRGPVSNPGKFEGLRVVALGDSITFGNELPVESTYPHQLREFLNESGPGYDVMNMAVPGYDILQEVSLLEERGLDYKPDLVVVGYCLNDAGVAGFNLKHLSFFYRHEASLMFRLRIVQFVAKKADVILKRNWLKMKNRADVFQEDYKSKIALIGEDERELRQLMQSSPKVYPSDWYRDDYRVGRLRHSFERLSEMAKRENFSVVIVVFPMLTADSGQYPHEVPHKIVAMEAERLGFDVFDVVNDFMDEGMPNLRISNKDLVHPNGLGHKIVAEKLKNYVHSKLPAKIE